MATTIPKHTKIQQMILSAKLNFEPNKARCAEAGKMTLTVMLHTRPTNVQMKLNDGTKNATAKAHTISDIFMIESVKSIAFLLQM
mmetsp:Transcript_1223/g.1560  ORF Transcript_1223/g.1560 Transcript_1223/m.1560 type:complete len:85 (-) Transcript_1223:197-451(-)|eukprot:CAMPEP_0178903934 /NCGR_PEP_ID=MMETSP0786-20121207/5424_1 /TAXON_ID=186022 /ORGANISM="Thalassionema frauenfeldii, Strain CCMP 1798" /LENGTH=84 /DNA_ID=CAMNT_0020575343 /DNA_START=303 /DNA_END=557 /DNA_ORIENTATION=-